VNGVTNPVGRKDLLQTPDQKTKEGTLKQLVNDVKDDKEGAVTNRLATGGMDLLKETGQGSEWSVEDWTGVASPVRSQV